MKKIFWIREECCLTVLPLHGGWWSGGVGARCPAELTPVQDPGWRMLDGRQVLPRLQRDNLTRDLDHHDRANRFLSENSDYKMESKHQ